MMKRLTFSIAAMAITLGASAQAGDATLIKAVAAYNDLPSRPRLLAFGPAPVTPGNRIMQLPDWLAQLDLNDREAAAAVAAFGVYGDEYARNYRSRTWGRGPVIAGTAAEILADSVGLRRSGPYPDAAPNEPPSRDLTEQRRIKLLSTIRDLGSCSGALVAVARKVAALRGSSEATRLLAKAKRDLGATALPPDDSCLS
jgi:hypothetical protein